MPPLASSAGAPPTGGGAPKAGVLSGPESNDGPSRGATAAALKLTNGEALAEGAIGEEAGTFCAVPKCAALCGPALADSVLFAPGGAALLTVVVVPIPFEVAMKAVCELRRLYVFPRRII